MILVGGDSFGAGLGWVKALLWSVRVWDLASEGQVIRRKRMRDERVLVMMISRLAMLLLLRLGFWTLWLLGICVYIYNTGK